MNEMTIYQMIDFIKSNPRVKVTHESFTDSEYIYADKSGNVWDECGYLFEDWKTDASSGLRLRIGDSGFENGWTLYHQESFNKELEILEQYQSEGVSPLPLKTCPICKGRAQLVVVKRPPFPLRKRLKYRRIRYLEMVRCTECGARTRLFVCTEDAVSNWNVRRNRNE